MAKKFNKNCFLILSTIFVIIVSIILFCCLFVDGETFAMHNYNMLIVILIALGLGAILFFVYRKIIKQNTNLSLRAEILVVSLVMLGLLLIEVLIARTLVVNLTWDPNEIYWGISHYFETGQIGNITYFTHYPFQLFLTTIEIIFIRGAWHLGLTMSIEGLQMVLNMLFITGTYLVTYLILRKLFCQKKALFGLGLALLFTPIILYTPILYSDTTSMFFISLGFYLFLWLTGKISRKWWQSGLLVIAFAATELFAFELKATSIIVLVAMIIYLLASFEKKYLKQFLMYALIFISVFLPGHILVQNYEKSIVDFSKQTPVTHWLMMAQQGYGDYTESDVSKTFDSIEHGEDTVSMNVQTIKERISQRGLFGNVGFLAKKISYVWGDGTYYVSAQLNKLPKHNNIMVDVFTSDGRYSSIYIYFAHGFQLLMLAIFCYGAVVTRRTRDWSLILKLTLMGLFVFFLVWETTSRYLLNYLPLFSILMTYFIDQIVIKLTENDIIKGSMKQRKDTRVESKK